MRTLILFRHAKSSWDEPGLDDFDRPLSERGAKAAPLMARWIMTACGLPDLILCSPAARTRATLALAMNEWTAPAIPVAFEDPLYLANADRLASRLTVVPPECACVMLVGHNPGVHALALDLAGTADKDDLVRLAMKFPTAGVAVLKLDQEWARIGPGACRLDAFETPRRLA